MPKVDRRTFIKVDGVGTAAGAVAAPGAARARAAGSPDVGQAGA